MKGRQFAIILVLLIALGGIALLLHSRRAASWRENATATEGKILKFPLNDVSHLTIKSSSAELNLIKKDDTWKVKERFDYPADFDKVSGLLRKLWELHPSQDVRVGPSQFGRLQLTEPGKDSNSGTVIDLKGDDDKHFAALLVGKKYLRESDQSFGRVGGIPAGRYVMELDGSNRVFLVSDTFDQVDVQPERWLNHELIKVENPKSIAVAGPSATMNWKLVRENASAPWKFADAKPNEELDSSKTSSLAALFSNASFTDVLGPKTPPAEGGLDKPSTSRIETFDNFVYELRIGKLTGENYSVLITVAADLPTERTPGKDEKPEEKARLDQEFQAKQKQLTDKLAKEKKFENWPYLIPRSTIDQLMKDRNTFLAEKKSPSPAPPSPPAGAKGGSITASPLAAPPVSPALRHSPKHR